MNIRPMKADEYEYVRYTLIPQVSGGDVVWSVDDLSEALADDHFLPYVLEIDGEPVAYAELHITRHPSRGCTGRIERVVVDKTHRRNGYASALLEKLEAVARSRECAYIVLKTESEKAAKVYEALGYEHQTQSINYWKSFR